MKVLTGQDYTEPRLYGIIAEMFYAEVGRLPKQNDITTMLTGAIVTNTTTNEIGYLIDENSEYFSLLPSIHVSRLVNVIDGDGWMDGRNEGI